MKLKSKLIWDKDNISIIFPIFSIFSEKGKVYLRYKPSPTHKAKTVELKSITSAKRVANNIFKRYSS